MTQSPPLLLSLLASAGADKGFVSSNSYGGSPVVASPEN